ncbi:putative U5 small nuclear ribonucleoprotein component [Drechslerella stenobrocha 248]|uniref:116 kDa U5 small nuclear ribonucleoprotein component n=1 Tax=Drechslerella stenobrocha 248 TaxID=1043628 RepID=W7I820_9PEZI|nr:putative U5 small nuclear ribonucleoprotein component [Drechslerella stenobrocha 248]
MDDLYDEFGNYIGDAGDSDEGSAQGDSGADAYVDFDRDDDDNGAEESDSGEGNDMQLMEVDEGTSNAVILHEDKQYYPTAEQVYGKDVEAMVQEEDAQPLSEPIIAPIKVKKFIVEEAELPVTHFSREFMMDAMSFPDQVRNVAVAGHLHHGKTAFMDMLVLETHIIDQKKAVGRREEPQLRYTDVHTLERERGVSIKSSPMSLVLQSSAGKSHLVNIMDTPGHVNFVDEVASSFRLADGVVLIVDVVEGLMINTEQIVRYAVAEGLPLVLVINKMDRLMLELKIPPTDAYFKVKHAVEQVNTIIAEAAPGRDDLRLSPEKGNVCFASTKMRWCFSLKSFAKMYADTHAGGRSNESGNAEAGFDVEGFAKRMWGDIYFSSGSRKFTRQKAAEQGAKRTFVHFVLEPLYKLYAHTIGESSANLKAMLAGLGITLKPAQYKMDAGDLLKAVCEQFFGTATGFVDMVLQHIPSPVDGAKAKIESCYTGPLDSDVAQSMLTCDPNGPLVVQITKLYNTTDATGFNAFGRVMSGTVKVGDQVRVLGEGYTIDDEEDMTIATISHVWVAETRYQVPTSGVPAGCWCLLGGIDNSIVKTATLVPPKMEDDAYIFRPIKHFTESVFKVAVEPVNPSELPKMLDGLRRINKSYPLVITKVEESGEHIILGTGELYMDCVLHDLRRLYSEMELKVSDPVTRFCETVVEMSALKCYALTPNKKNKITMVAEPLEEDVARDIEGGKVSIKWPIRKVGNFFVENHGWDVLASRSIWAFGPEETSPNILQDDTLPSEVDKKLLNTVRDSIKQGFAWGTREGPLCEEPIRNTKFRLMDASLASEAIYRGGGQIIPTARRACYSSFLMASPRLMEPMYSCHMTGPADSVSPLYTVLAKRRGHVLTDGPIAGTPLYLVKGLIPVIDSFGFETDLRIHTQGQAFVSLVFDKWSVVPGDPLDKEIKLRPLEPANAQALARDFTLKTRRRKGLSEDVTIAKFLEPELQKSLQESGLLG